MSLRYVQSDSGIWLKRTSSIDHYSPEFLQRAAAMWRDPRIGNKYFVNSGSRSYAAQVVLYAKYKLGGTLAAKPGTSNHEYGSARHPLTTAMDVNPMNGGSYRVLHAVAYEYGFHFPLLSEAWHMEMRPGRGAIPNGVTPETEEYEMPQCVWDDGAIAQVNAIGEVFCPEIPNRSVAKHWGGMTQLRDDAKRSFSGKCTVIAPIYPGDSQAGYYILDEQYGLNDENWKFDSETLPKFGK